MTPHTTSIRSTIAALLLLTAAACGSSTDKASSPASASPTSAPPPTAPPTSDVADTEPTAPDTVAETTDSTTGEPEIIDSVTVETVTIPADDSTVESAVEELRDGVPTEKGKTYAIIDPTSGTGLSLVSSVDGAYPFLVFNVAALSLDEEGTQGLIAVSSLDRLRTFIDPTSDVMQIPPTDIESVTEPVAADYLAWVGALPGVTVGPVEETTVDGWPARSMTYAFGPTHNGLPCDDTSLAGCLFTVWNPAGSIAFYGPDETGTLYEAVVDGSRALIDVTFRPGAQEMFETVHFLLEDKG